MKELMTLGFIFVFIVICVIIIYFIFDDIFNFRKKMIVFRNRIMENKSRLLIKPEDLINISFENIYPVDLYIHQAKDCYYEFTNYEIDDYIRKLFERISKCEYCFSKRKSSVKIKDNEIFYTNEKILSNVKLEFINYYRFILNLYLIFDLGDYVKEIRKYKNDKIELLRINRELEGEYNKYKRYLVINTCDYYNDIYEKIDEKFKEILTISANYQNS